MYDAAARDFEMLGMRLCDFNDSKRTVSVIGKGSKQRLIPVTSETAQHFLRYAEVFHRYRDPQKPLFYTIRNGIVGPMSDDNVARFIKGYAASARQERPEVPGKVHPHVFRHSRSMHLLKSYWTKTSDNRSLSLSVYRPHTAPPLNHMTHLFEQGRLERRLRSLSGY